MTLSVGQGFTSQVVIGDLAPIPFAFPVFANVDGAIDVAVEVRDTTTGALIGVAVLPTDYTIALNGAGSPGGVVTPLNAALFASGRTAWLQRTTKAQQEAKLAELVRFPAQVVEAMADRQTAGLQDVQRDLGLALKVRLGETPPTLPAAADVSEGDVLVYDADGNLVAKQAIDIGSDLVVGPGWVEALEDDASLVLDGRVRYAATVTALRAVAASARVDGERWWVGGKAVASGGGEGMFRWSAANLSSQVTADLAAAVYVAPNDATSGASGAFIREVNPRADMDPAHYNIFGTFADGVRDAQIKQMLDAANGRKLRLRGDIAVTGAALMSGTACFTAGASLTLEGEGSGAGPGAAATSATQCTRITKFANDGADLFHFSDLNPFRISGLQLDVWPSFRPQTGGSGLKISGAAGVNQSSVIEDVSIINFYDGITLEACSFPEVGTRVVISNWVRYGLHITTVSGIEGSAGLIQGFYRGDTANGTTQDACICVETGYGEIRAGLLGAKYGVKWVPTIYDAGNLKIGSGSHIEENDIAAIFASGAGGRNASMLQGFGFEISSGLTGGITKTNIEAAIKIVEGGNPNWLESWEFGNFIVRSSMTKVGSAYIDIAVGKGNLSNFSLYASGINVATGIRIANTSGTVQISGAKLVGFNVPYELHAGVTVDDIATGVTVAQLPTCANGSRFWCPDGTPGTSPLTGSGPGCFAARVGGAWIGLQVATRASVAVGALTPAADKLPYFTSTTAAALADLTSAGRALLDDADAAAQRATLALGTAALVADSGLVHLTGAEVITGAKTFGDGTATAGITINGVGGGAASGVYKLAGTSIWSAGAGPGTGTQAFNFHNLVDNVIEMSIGRATRGVIVGAPTGSFKGTGTLNATAVYDDNTLLTCYVLDAALDGVIDFDKWDAKVPDRVHPALFIEVEHPPEFAEIEVEHPPEFAEVQVDHPQEFAEIEVEHPFDPASVEGPPSKRMPEIVRTIEVYALPIVTTVEVYPLPPEISVEVFPLPPERTFELVVAERVEPRRHDDARKFAARLGGAFDPLTVDGYTRHWKEKRHLPSMPNEDKFDPVAGMATGSWIQRLVEDAEIKAVLIDKLYALVKANVERIDLLERKQ